MQELDAVKRALARNDLDTAVRICEQEPCEERLECQKSIAWHLYRQGRWADSKYWFTKAANTTDGEAFFGLGSAFWNQQEFDQSYENFEHAAKAGYSRAFHWLAAFFHHGLGREVNLNRARELYAESAKHGYLIGERGLIDISLKEGRQAKRVFALSRLIVLLIRAGLIAIQDTRDQRLIDVPRRFNLQ